VPYIIQIIAKVKEKILNTWIKFVLQSGSANGSKPKNSPGSSRAAMCYSICVLTLSVKKNIGRHGRPEGLWPVCWVQVVS